MACKDRCMKLATEQERGNGWMDSEKPLKVDEISVEQGAGR